MRFLIFAIFLIISLVASSKLKQTTYWDADRKIIKEVFFYKLIKGDTIKHGDYQLFYENGALWQQGEYKNNLLEGRWIDNHPNGSRKQDLFFVKDLLEGEVRTYYETGQLFQISNFKSDIPMVN